MVQPILRSAIPLLAGRPHRQNGGWERRSYVLYLVRQQAQAGLLRDGGMIPREVGAYVRQLRSEIESDIAFRARKLR
jgi:hypothetical protein